MSNEITEQELLMPFLYILMRTDLESMNPGKAVAQGAHAANQFAYVVEQCRDANEGNDINGGPEDRNPELWQKLKLYDYWSSRGSGFGTTICLDVDDDVLHRLIPAASRMGMFAGITHDPSYPVRDGDVTHFIPLDTCGYIFGNKAELSILLGQFNLMP